MTPFTVWDVLARWLFWRPLYRPVMRLAHRFNWHHMTVCRIEGDTMDWCQWCGIRQIRSNWQEPPLEPLSINHDAERLMALVEDTRQQINSIF